MIVKYVNPETGVTEFETRVDPARKAVLQALALLPDPVFRSIVAAISTLGGFIPALPQDSREGFVELRKVTLAYLREVQRKADPQRGGS